MQLGWELKKPLRGIGAVQGTHRTFTSAVEGIRRMVTEGVYVGHTGARDIEIWRITWQDIKRLVLVEQYEDDEGKLKQVVQQFRAFFKKHGRRIRTVKQDYVFPQDMYASGIGLECDSPRPDKVQVTFELEE